MDLVVAGGLASVLSLVAFIMIAVRHIAPWLGRHKRGAALTALLWVQAFRYLALQIFSAQKAGFAVSDAVRDQIAYGDLAGAILALAAIAALWQRARIAIALIWLLVVETIADLVLATVAGVREQFFANASGVTWLILTVYVQMLWVSIGAIIWQMHARRNEPI